MSVSMSVHLFFSFFVPIFIRKGWIDWAQIFRNESPKFRLLFILLVQSPFPSSFTNMYLYYTKLQESELILAYPLRHLLKYTECPKISVNFEMATFQSVFQAFKKFQIWVHYLYYIATRYLRICLLVCLRPKSSETAGPICLNFFLFFPS